MANKSKKKKSDLTPLELAKEAIRKKYGSIITMLPEYKFGTLECISTGIISLDAILGNGGMAKGRLYEIFGEPGSGKSSLAYSLIREAQKEGFTCGIVDAEHSLDPSLVKSMGVDIDSVCVVSGITGEENLDAAEMLIRTGEIDVLVIDSVSALIPASEMESDITDDFMGLLARLMGKACRRLSQLASVTNTLVIFINQVRQTFNKFTSGDKEPTGGEALKFFATGRLRVEGGKYKKSRVMDQAGNIIGHVCKIVIEKNKLAPPHRSCEALLIYGKGFDREWELVKLAVELDVVQKHGSWYKYNDENIAQGELNFMGVLKDNLDFALEIESKILEVLGMTTTDVSQI